MKKETAHTWILLRDSGELSARKTRKLENQLRINPDLQALEKALHTLKEAGKQDAPPTPPPLTSRLMFEARKQGRARARERGFDWSLWQPALAYGAIAIALGMTLIYFQNTAQDPAARIGQPPTENPLLQWDPPYAEELAILLAEIQAFEERWGAPDVYPSETDIETLARQLLPKEG